MTTRNSDHRLQWRQRKWSEANPTAELFDFEFHNGIVTGTVVKSNDLNIPNETFKTFEVFIFHEYKDHYFILTGNDVRNRKYFLARKINERK